MAGAEAITSSFCFLAAFTTQAAIKSNALAVNYVLMMMTFQAAVLSR